MVLTSRLEAFCRAHKQVAAGHSYPLLRKARRLDALVIGPSSVERAQTRQDNTTAQKGAETRCSQCQTEFSPCFYPLDLSTPLTNGHVTPAYLCHRCYWPTLAPRVEAMVIDVPAEPMAVVPEPIVVG